MHSSFDLFSSSVLSRCSFKITLPWAATWCTISCSSLKCYAAWRSSRFHHVALCLIHATCFSHHELLMFGCRTSYRNQSKVTYQLWQVQMDEHAGVSARSKFSLWFVAKIPGWNLSPTADDTESFNEDINKGYNEFYFLADYFELHRRAFAYSQIHGFLLFWFTFWVHWI